MRVLVLGGTQFIGHAVVKELVARGDEVVVAHRGRHPLRVDGVRPVPLDRDDAAQADVLGAVQADVVVDISGTTAERVQRAVNAVSQTGCDHYVLISSAAVYSDPAQLPYREWAQTGGAPVWSPYGEEKSAAEVIVADSGISSVSIVRPPYVYGPWNYEDRERFFWSRLASRGSIFIPGDGTTIVQFCYVYDLARVVADLVHGGIAPGTYNVGSADAVSFNDLIGALRSVSGLLGGGRVVHVGDPGIPTRSYFPFRSVDFVTSTQRISQCGIRFASLEQGLRETWQWYAEDRHDQVIPLMPGEKQLIGRHL